MENEEKEKKVQTFLPYVVIKGLNNANIKYLASWYSYFTNRRYPGHESGSGYSLGATIIDDKSIRKGLMFLGNILSRMDNFDSPLYVEPINYKRELAFKCKNKNGENLVVFFQHGDYIESATKIFIISSDKVKVASVHIFKGIIFDKLTYRNEDENYYYTICEKIYNMAYGINNENNHNFKR